MLSSVTFLPLGLTLKPFPPRGGLWYPHPHQNPFSSLPGLCPGQKLAISDCQSEFPQPENIQTQTPELLPNLVTAVLT